MWLNLLYSGFETCFGPSAQGAETETHLKSRFCAILKNGGEIICVVGWYKAAYKRKQRAVEYGEETLGPHAARGLDPARAYLKKPRPRQLAKRRQHLLRHAYYSGTQARCLVFRGVAGVAGVERWMMLAATACRKCRCVPTATCTCTPTHASTCAPTCTAPAYRDRDGAVVECVLVGRAVVECVFNRLTELGKGKREGAGPASRVCRSTRQYQRTHTHTRQKASAEQQ